MPLSLNLGARRRWEIVTLRPIYSWERTPVRNEEAWRALERVWTCLNEKISYSSWNSNSSSWPSRYNDHPTPSAMFMDSYLWKPSFSIRRIIVACISHTSLHCTKGKMESAICITRMHSTFFASISHMDKHIKPFRILFTLRILSPHNYISYNNHTHV